MSEQAWAEAWVKAWADMPDIGQGHTVDVRKEGKKVFSYTYASLHDILKEVKPVLTKNGFAVSQSPTPQGIETHITHKDGFTKVFGPLPMPQSNDPKAIGSGITYGRRYGLTAALGIATDEDVDAPEAAEKMEDGQPREPEQAPRTPDAHDELWTFITERFPVTDRQTVFFDALVAGGVDVDAKKRANKTQATKARKYLDELLEKP